MIEAVKYIVIAAASAVLFACGGRSGSAVNGSAKSSASTAPRQFTFPAPPAAVPPGEQQAWLCEHFWDRFEFADSAYVAAQDSSSIIGLFVLYAMQLVDPADPSPLARLMKRAEASPHAFRYFLSIADEVLHNPNSPYRDDERYIPVLECAVASPLLDEAEKTAPRHDLLMARRNRIGHAANDFTFTDIHGRNATLYSVASRWTLLFFSNPGCPLCAEIARLLTESAAVTQALTEGRLTIVMLYPDDDVEAWRGHAPEIPAAWIYARDADSEIRRRQLYDLKAIPALYLLDAEKRVRVKDASELSLIEMHLASSSFDR